MFFYCVRVDGTGEIAFVIEANPNRKARHPDAGRGPRDDPRVRFRALNSDVAKFRSTEPPSALKLSWVPAFAGMMLWTAPYHRRLGAIE